MQMTEENKTVTWRIIACSACGIVGVLAGAWGASVNTKLDRIEVSLSEIKTTAAIALSQTQMNSYRIEKLENKNQNGGNNADKLR